MEGYMNKRLKQLNGVLVLVLLLSNFLPGMSAGLPRAASAYDPPPSATVAPPLTPAAPTVNRPVVKTPPAPDDLSPEAERARVEQAAQVVLDKYAAYYGPRYQMAVSEVVVKDDWAYAVATSSDSADEPLYILASRDPGGIWQTQMPDTGGSYLQWLTEIPSILLSAIEKNNLRRAAEDIMARRQAVAPLPTQQPAPISKSPVEPTPTPTPMIMQPGYDSPEQAIEAAVKQYRQSLDIDAEVSGEVIVNGKWAYTEVTLQGEVSRLTAYQGIHKKWYIVPVPGDSTISSNATWMDTQPVNKNEAPASTAMTVTSPFENLNALILVDPDSELAKTLEEKIRTLGGEAGIVFAPGAVLAELSPTNDTRLLTMPGVQAVHRTFFPVEKIETLESTQKLAVSVWNQLLTPSPKVLSAPAPDSPQYSDALIAPDRVNGDMPLAPSNVQTSEFMYGSVQVDIFLVESNGATENWTSQMRDEVVNQIAEGLNWWRTTSMTGGNPAAKLIFHINVHDPWNEPSIVATTYEPITLSSEDEGLWITEIMNNLGYSSGGYFERVRAYVNDRRITIGTDWGFAIFVVNSLNDPDGEFSNNNGAFAYAYPNGPFMVQTYDNDGWTIDRMKIVTAHETGHIFGAADEYAGSNCRDDTYHGYLHVQNTNCENGNPATENSIMRSSDNQQLAYSNYQASTPVKGQIGWRDSDGDGWYDVIDTLHNNLVPYNPNPTKDNNLVYNNPNQRAYDTPYEYSPGSSWADWIYIDGQYQPGTPHSAVSINRVKDVWFKVDGGPPSLTTSVTPPWGDEEEYYAFAVNGLRQGTHVIQTFVTNKWSDGVALTTDIVTVLVGDPNPTPTPTPSPTPPTPPPSGDWQISYFNNPDLIDPSCHQEGLTGAYVFKDWGDTAPGGSCGQDNFSARARRTLYFDAGDYTFYLFADDHARLLVSGNVVVDQWPPATAHVESRHLSAGDYEVVVEYRDTGGRGVLEAWWTGPSFPAMPQEQQVASQWYGEYWANRHWWENPVFRRNEGTSLPFNHDWGDSGPGYGLPSDRFATRFTRTAYFECGRYRFEFNADDYAELRVDPTSPLLSLSGNGSQSGEVDVPAGNHTVQASHREEDGGASLYINWTLLTPCEPPTATPSPTPTPTPKPTSTATPTPTPTPTATAQPTATPVPMDTPTPTDTPTPSPTPPVPACTDPYEPNDAIGQATAISYGQVIGDAQICSTGDADYYVFNGYAGSRIVVNIDAQVNGSTLDSYLDLLDVDGLTILVSNDDDGSSTDSYLEYILPYGGAFYLKVRDYWDRGGPDYFYSLSLSSLLTVDQASITDGVGNPKDAFYPGETIGLWTTANNHAIQVISTTWSWDTQDSLGQRVLALYMADWPHDLPPGAETWGIVATLPEDLPGGEYIFYGQAGAGNDWDHKSHTFTVNAPPDLVPSREGDWDAMLVPSSVTDTHSLDTLYAGATTYLDWGVRNNSGLDITETFYVDLYLDDVRFVHYPFNEILAGSSIYFLDWSESFSQGGWHTLKIVVEPENTVAEADETNNVWEQSFYWEYNCADPWEPNDTPDTATVLTYGQALSNMDICPPGDVDYYVFNGKPGDIVAANLDAQINGSALDSYLELLDNDGVTLLAYNDDQDSLDSYITHTLSHSGTVYLKVREYNDPYEGDFTYFYTLSLSGTLATAAPYADDMENGINGWTASGLWHQIDASNSYSASHSAPHSWWYGQDDTGTYDTGATNAGSLTSPPVYIPDAGYYLRFWYAYQTESQSTAFDQRLVQISADGGPFITVLQLYDDLMESWWPSPAIDLSAYAGQTIQIRFYFDTLDEFYNAYRGWYIDDIDISTTPPPTCADPYEPNNAYDQAKAIVYGDSPAADICPNGDYDFYRFTGAAGDQVVVDIDAETNGSQLDSYLYLLDSDGTTILTLSDDDYVSHDSHLGYALPHDGDYYLKIKAWNHPAVGSPDHFYTLHLRTDDADPTAQMETPPNGAYLAATASISVTAADDRSVQRVEFLWHDNDWANSDWQWLGVDWNGNDGWSLDWDTSVITEQSDIVLYVWAYDWVGHWIGAASWSLTVDRTPPGTVVNVTQPYGNAPFRDFWVNWWDSQDNLSGIAGYDVQYRDGADGTWTDLLLDTTEVYTRFVGTDDHTYYFRVRARDFAGNQSDYTEDDGDAQHTVDICDIAPDDHETDDDAAHAINWFFTNGVSQTYNIHSEGNPDWVKFYAVAGVTYTLLTTDLGGHADTVLYLYDTDGSTLIDYNDDYWELGYASHIDWQPDVSGMYYASVAHWDPWAYGCTTEYGFSIGSNDTSAPTGGIVINADQAYTPSPVVTLTLTANDDGTGLAYVLLSNNSDFSDAYLLSYTPTLTWTLGVGDDLKTVYAQFYDWAGNGSAIYDDDILLDTTLPSGSISINNGDEHTTSRAVTLNLMVNDNGTGVNEMRVSNMSGFNGVSWQAYASSLTWNLTTDAGTKTVYIQFRDQAGNASEVYNDAIIFYEPVTANFTADSTHGAAPLTAQFTDQSTGSVASWEWDFGDGRTSTLQNPAHSYITPGVYPVSLTVRLPGTAASLSGGMDTLVRAGYIVATEAHFVYLPLVIRNSSSSLMGQENASFVPD